MSDVKRLLDEATPLPWESIHPEGARWDGAEILPLGIAANHADARLIVHAVNHLADDAEAAALPASPDVVEALRTDVEAMVSGYPMKNGKPLGMGGQGFEQARKRVLELIARRAAAPAPLPAAKPEADCTHPESALTSNVDWIYCTRCGYLEVNRTTSASLEGHFCRFDSEHHHDAARVAAPDPALIREASVEKMHRDYDHPANRLIGWIGTATARRLTWAERDDALAALDEYRTRLREGGW